MYPAIFLLIALYCVCDPGLDDLMAQLDGKLSDGSQDSVATDAKPVGKVEQFKGIISKVADKGKDTVSAIKDKVDSTMIDAYAAAHVIYAEKQKIWEKLQAEIESRQNYFATIQMKAVEYVTQAKTTFAKAMELAKGAKAKVVAIIKDGKAKVAKIVADGKAAIAKIKDKGRELIRQAKAGGKNVKNAWGDFRNAFKY